MQCEKHTVRHASLCHTGEPERTDTEKNPLERARPYNKDQNFTMSRVFGCLAKLLQLSMFFFSLVNPNTTEKFDLLEYRIKPSC